VCIEREGVFGNFSARQHHTPANGTASPHSDDIDPTQAPNQDHRTPTAWRFWSPRHPPDTTEYGQIEYGGLPVLVVSEASAAVSRVLKQFYELTERGREYLRLLEAV